MTELPVTVDPGRLRAVADHLEQAADALTGCPVPGPDPGALRGSAVGALAGPPGAAAQVRQLATDLHGWASAARNSADALANADRDNASRL
ncbi:DUF7162 family protein [Mycolicibacterium mengxianglii]|uniref:DUF7162 family protein n=1 Tax=Mycolicibacterium mengxianglii TaxID=2736649 RepID=UPI0018D08CF9|nr:hypothetical protein [Mycolicibacterium mengxianglii]